MYLEHLDYISTNTTNIYLNLYNSSIISSIYDAEIYNTHLKIILWNFIVNALELNTLTLVKIKKHHFQILIGEIIFEKFNMTFDQIYQILAILI